MCDYSLHALASRPAKVGDRLVSCSFDGTYTRGFCAVGEPRVAICLAPGTELAFEREVETDHPFKRLLPSLGFGQTGAVVARFRRVNMTRPDQHHDALEFANGRIVLVTRLSKGQCATVLQLPAAPVRVEPSHTETTERLPEHDPATA